ncbi:MAG: putative signal transducing protein [Caldilineaceae bacterium]
MKVCPNRECPFLAEYGEMAEYRDEIAHCVDCGAPLVYRSQAPLLPSADEGNEEDDEAVDADELVVIATFDHPEKAHIYRAHLEAVGIPAFLFDEHTMTNNRLLTSALGGVRLAVPESAAKRALTVLDDPELAANAQDDDDEIQQNDSERLDQEFEDESEDEAEIDQPMEPMNCLRCQGEMKYLKEYKFESQDNNRGLFGAIFDIEERLTFDIYVCTGCRHTEFFFTGSSKKWDG